MRVSDLGGEQALIELIADRFGAKPDASLIEAIGDDAAVALALDEAIILTCDMLIEGTHFRRDIIDPFDLGWKSVAVNISDIAAMGGEPTYTLVSVAVEDQEVAFIEESYRGISEACQRFGSKLVGGDTCFTERQMVYSVFQLGKAAPDRLLRRSAARPGDVIFITGALGDSRAGLELLLKHGLEKARQLDSAAVTAHTKPMPRVREGRLLAEMGIRCAMDVSDGLASDLPKLCQASKTGAVVSLDKVPVGGAARRVAEMLGSDPARFAVEGGEDYELLFTAAPDRVGAVESAFAQAELPTPSDIGVIVESAEVLLALPNGTSEPLRGGWQHFPGGAS